MFVDVGAKKLVHLEFIEQKEYSGIIELEVDLGKARDFVRFYSDTGEMEIKPDNDHAGDYTVKVKMLDSYEEYEKTMYLKIIWPVTITKIVSNDAKTVKKVPEELESTSNKET